MDDTNAMIAKTARWQRRMNCGLITDKKKRGNLFVGLKRELRARDDNPATVVATHDIHCNSHRWNKCGNYANRAITRLP
jgi:hypothetical protein